MRGEHGDQAAASTRGYYTPIAYKRAKADARPSRERVFIGGHAQSNRRPLPEKRFQCPLLGGVELRVPAAASQELGMGSPLIELDDDLLAQAAKYSTARTKRRLIQEALATFVAVKEQERRSATYRERLEKVRARVLGMRLGVDARDLVRLDRDSR